MIPRLALVSATFASASATSVSTSPVPSIVDGSFETFVQHFGKTYETATHEAEARINFEHSLELLRKMRRLSPRAQFSVNAHADMSHTQWRSSFGGGYVPQSVRPLSPVEDEDPMPVAQEIKPKVPKIDWREHGAVDPTIYDQGECGCCWAISVAQTIGSQWFLAKNATTVPALSFQQLICCDCKSVDAGCHGGDPHMAYNYIAKAGGLESRLLIFLCPLLVRWERLGPKSCGGTMAKCKTWHPSGNSCDMQTTLTRKRVVTLESELLHYCFFS